MTASKLTLSVPMDAVSHGKRVAEAAGVSLSKLVTQFLSGLEMPATEAGGMDNRVSRMFGAYQLPTDVD
ncbi:MAG TPA: DUF6364 family protein, partial [Fibrobacteraceae bacterium]|nr:DUF6364 family protein [Fibrobacteraceae bacterium]